MSGLRSRWLGLSEPCWQRTASPPRGPSGNLDGAHKTRPIPLGLPRVDSMGSLPSGQIAPSAAERRIRCTQKKYRLQEFAFRVECPLSIRSISSAGASALAGPGSDPKP